jgi:hypothetical protein
MEFTKRKLQKEDLPSLFRVKIETVKPFALMLGPAYLYLKANEKFVSVKGPLDFFLEAELSRLQPFQYFYFPHFVNSVIPIRQAGQKVRAILSLQDAFGEKTEETAYPEVTLAPASYEVSDSVLREIGPVWWNYPKHGLGVDPFFITVFVNEICDLLPPQLLAKAREQDVTRMDGALFRSSWVVFLALHIGYVDLEFLNELRLRVFEEYLQSGDANGGKHNEIDELIEVAYQSFVNSNMKLLTMETFNKRKEKVSQKLVDRFKRIRKDLYSQGPQPPTIYGERGFIDV